MAKTEPSKPLDLAAAIPAALRSAHAGELPAVAVDGGVIRLRYPSPALHAARVSADVEALCTLPGLTVVDHWQDDELANGTFALLASTVSLRLAR